MNKISYKHKITLDKTRQYKTIQQVTREITRTTQYKTTQDKTIQANTYNNNDKQETQQKQ